MNIINICSSAVIVILILCIGLGFWRGWKKSLIRLSIVLGCFLVSLFVGPAIASALMKKFVNGFVLTIFSFEIDFESVAGSLISDEQLVESLFSAGSTTSDLTSALMNVIINVLIFLLMFIILLLVSLLVYVIVGAVLKKTSDNQKPEKNGKYWGLKAVGGLIGLVGGVVVCFAFLTPLFGAMNICNRFLTESNEIASASAVSVQNTTNKISGKLYFTEDEKIGKVEGYIETYSKFKQTYDKSFMGAVFNFTGISKLGTKTFDYLTNVKAGGLNVNLTDELVSFIKLYNAYKKTFVENKFNLANNESVESLKLLYSYATESEIVKSYVAELVPQLCEKWQSNEGFFGLKLPVGDTFKPLTKELLNVFNTNSFSRIDENIKVLLDAITVANNNGLILKMQENVDLITFLDGNDTFIKDEILQLVKSADIKVVLPKVVNCFMTIAHKEIIGSEKDYNTDEFTLTQVQMEQLDWNKEAQTLQNLTNGILEVYNKTKDSKDSEILTTCLKDIGTIVDDARASVLISRQLKVFIVEFINSKEFGLESIASSINDKWEDETFRFEDMFGVIEAVVKVAQNIINDDGSVDLTNLGVTLETILVSGSYTVKPLIRDILDSDIVADIVGTSKEAEIMTDLLDTLLDCDDSTEISNGIAAAQEIVNIVDDYKNQNGIVLDGDTDAEKQKSAKQIIETIGSSEIVMGMLEDALDDGNSSLAGITSTVGGDADILRSAIDGANINGDYKTILNDLFGN